MPDIHSLPLQVHPFTEQLARAVYETRHARHHPDCSCGNYRRDGAGYCTAAELTWCSMVDRLIDQVRLN